MSSFIELDRPLVSIDLETTGINSKRDRICQIGLVKLYPDGNETCWETLVNPTIDIPVEASDVHHITDEMVEDEPTFNDIAQMLFIALKGCDLVGYNIRSFDVPFLQAEFERSNLKFATPRVIDAYRIWTKFYPRNLASAVKFYLSESHEEAHSALPDARVSMRIFQQQLTTHPELPRSVQEIHDLFFAGHLDSEGKFSWLNGIAIVNFGRAHKGKPLKDVPRGYFQWMIDDPGFNEDVKDICRAALQGKYPERK